MAASHNKSEKWPDFYAQRVDDAGSHAAGSTSSCATRRIHHISDGGSRGRTERSIADMGHLQRGGPKVCAVFALYRLFAKCSCSVATGYGQPPSTIYDWALEPASLKNADYRLPDELKTRLRIEKFCDRVTKSLYNGRPDPAEFISMEKLLIVRILENELREMELDLASNISRELPPGTLSANGILTAISEINMIHLRAADLHLRYFVFLSSNARSDDLANLFLATTSFLGRVLELETSPGNLLAHATNYILQMIVSAAFALMKLLKSPFSRQIDMDHGKFLFNGAISSIRRISVVDNDRPVRLANVISQMWNSGSSTSLGDEALQLGIRSRMSMSHVYDTVWRWRRRFKPKTSEEGHGE